MRYNHDNMPSSPKLLLPVAYVRDATKHIQQAKSSVSFVSLVVANDHKTDYLIDSLSDAAKRGVNVEVAADVFTYGDQGGFFWPTLNRFRQSRLTTRMSQKFLEDGVRFTWLGRSSSLIYSGRTHIKWCVADDTVYTFGGVNLSKGHIENYDYMFKIKDHDLARRLTNEHHRLIRADAGGYAYPSHSFKYGNDTVLIDGGLFGDSIIYRRACKLASEATKIVFVSQYCPSGKLSRLLKKTDSQLYFNPPLNAQAMDRFAIRIGMLVSRNKTLYSKPRYLHAKFMIFDMPNGRRVALTGSHNLSPGGVILGTREIALETEDPKIIEQLDDFLKEITT
jgi:cardiolipin synthase